MTTINGLILAGGKSQRMGTDKGLLNFHGKPQREYLFDLLSEVCNEVYTSHKTGIEIPEFLNPLPDRFDIESPLNGILSAFNHTPNTAWLTVPVDMPNINPSIIRFLLQYRNPDKLVTCFTDSEGKDPEPLFALWEPAAFPFLKKYYETGGKGVKYFLLHQAINLISSPDARIHININSMDDLSKYRNPSD